MGRLSTRSVVPAAAWMGAASIWVACGGSEPCVGVHVYGTDIGNWQRRAYDPDDGSVSWFTSGWSTWPPLSEAVLR